MNDVRDLWESHRRARPPEEIDARLSEPRQKQILMVVMWKSARLHANANHTDHHGPQCCQLAFNLGFPLGGRSRYPVGDTPLLARS